MDLDRARPVAPPPPTRSSGARARGCSRALAVGLAVAAGMLSPAAAQAPPPEARNTRHALIIGVGQYSAPGVPTLEGVVHDMVSARQMARAMAVPDRQTTVLRDHEATAERIRREITALQQRMADGDRLFVYYSGHGTRWHEPGTSGDGCTEGLLAADGQVLSNQEMGQRLAPLAQRADKMLVFYDACFSGGVAGAPFRTRSLGGAGGAGRITPKFTTAGAPAACSQPSNFRTRSLSGVLERSRALPQNVVHVAASRPDELSFDSAQLGGLATAAWRDCLLGQAQDRDGSGAVSVAEVTHCAQGGLTRSLAGHEGISGQQMTVAGNPHFVPAAMGMAFAAPAPPAVPAPAPAAEAPAAPAASTAVPTSAATVPPAPPPATSAPAAPVLQPVAAPPATPAELLADLHHQRDGQRGVTARARQPRLKIGQDALELDITAQRDGFLYLALAGSDGRSLYLLYPNDLAGDNRVRAGQTVRLPGPTWEIVAGGPAGTETLLVMVTDAPRDLSGLQPEKAGPFLKTLLDPQGRARLQGILAQGTPAAGCGKPGAPSCSDAYGSALLQVQAVP